MRGTLRGSCRSCRTVSISLEGEAQTGAAEGRGASEQGGHGSCWGTRGTKRDDGGEVYVGNARGPGRACERQILGAWGGQGAGGQGVAGQPGRPTGRGGPSRPSAGPSPGGARTSGSAPALPFLPGQLGEMPASPRWVLPPGGLLEGRHCPETPSSPSPAHRVAAPPDPRGLDGRVSSSSPSGPCLCTSRPKQKHKGRKSIHNPASSLNFCSSPGCPRFRFPSDSHVPFGAR